MGVVYRATDARLGRKVALKVLPAEYGDDQAYRARFLRESRLAASIDHQGVIPIYESGDAGGQLFIAMPIAMPTTGSLRSCATTSAWLRA